MMQHGWDIDGRRFSEQRGISMTATKPPEDYTWTTKEAADYQNRPPINTAEKEVWKSLRLEWLNQFALTIVEDKKFRYWFWRTTKGKISKTHWWERRLLSEPLPTTPGLWPLDG